MLKLLLKKQLFEIFRSYFYDAKKNKARSRLATALYIGLFVLLMAGILGGIFTLLAVKLCDKVAIIQGGRLIRSGTMEEVKGDDSLEQVFLELEDETC